MYRVFIKGDLHGEIEELERIATLIPKPTKRDLLIVLGDFGVIFADEKTSFDNLLRVAKLPYTLAFVDGNHENFDLIKKLETSFSPWHGGEIGVLPWNIIHLKRGEIYEINNRKIAVMGGADSIDKFTRVEGVSWWKEERISDKDINNLVRNMNNKKVNSVDFILTHDAPAHKIPEIALYSGINGFFGFSPSQQQLERVYSLLKFKKWYFGHWHMDNKIISDNFECLFREVKRII